MRETLMGNIVSWLGYVMRGSRPAAVPAGRSVPFAQRSAAPSETPSSKNDLSPLWLAQGRPLQPPSPEAPEAEPPLPSAGGVQSPPSSSPPEPPLDSSSSEGVPPHE